MAASDQPELLGSILAARPKLTTRSPEAEAEFQAGTAKLREQRKAAEVREWTLRLAQDLGPRYTLERANLETFHVYHDAQKTALARIAVILSRLNQMASDGAGLVFYGWVGTGKDHLAAALLYMMAQITSCRWINGRKIFSESRDRIKEERVEREMIDSLTDPGVLCISDPIPIEGSQSSWNIDLLYRIIDERYHLLRPTWMTINVRDAADAESRLTKPIWDRLRERADLVPCFWPSYRRERT